MDVRCSLQEQELNSLNNNYPSMSFLASELTFQVQKFGLAFTLHQYAYPQHMKVLKPIWMWRKS
jgi:hypothetical protein